MAIRDEDSGSGELKRDARFHTAALTADKRTEHLAAGVQTVTATMASVDSSIPPEEFSMDSNAPAGAAPSARVHSFRLNQQLTRQLPSGPVQPAIDVPKERYSVLLDLCRRPSGDLCGNPDPTLCGAGNPLSGEPMKVLGYSNAGGPSSPPVSVGVSIPALRFRRRVGSVDELSAGFAAAAEALVGRRFDKDAFTTGIRDNIATGRWTMSYAGEGVAFGYDPIRGRARLANLSPNDSLDPNGHPITISGSAAGSVIEHWLSELQAAGLPRAEYWTIEHPEGTEVYETDPAGGYRVWAYSYTIRRQINDIPVMAQSMTIWIHRSGKVAYLESMLPGLPMEDAWLLNGPPKAEVSRVRDVHVTVPFSVALRAAVSFAEAKYGVSAEVVESWAGYQHQGALPNADEAEAEIDYTPRYYFRVVGRDDWVAYRPLVVSVPVDGEGVPEYAQ